MCICVCIYMYVYIYIYMCIYIYIYIYIVAGPRTRPSGREGLAPSLTSVADEWGSALVRLVY